MIRIASSVQGTALAPDPISNAGGYLSCKRFAKQFPVVAIEAHGLHLSVVSRRHFFSVAPDWRHVTGTTMAALGDLRGFGGERR